MRDWINCVLKQPDGGLAEVIRKPRCTLRYPFHDLYFGRHFSRGAAETDAIPIHQGKPGGVNWIDPKLSTVFDLEQAFRTGRELPRVE